ncbi:MAG: glycosyltransferase family A protein [Vicinamibacterales bacterium]
MTRDEPLHALVRQRSMSPPSDKELVSVLVATRNRADDLKKCVVSLLASSYQPFEVIVVDQSPTVTALPADPRLSVISSTSVGKTSALNIGLKRARGTVLAFTDDDCTVPPEWIARGVERLRAHADVGLIFGALTPAPHDPAVSLIPSFMPPAFEVHKGLAEAQVRAGAGANMFARRALFDAVAGFDERLGPGAEFRSCEEFDLYYRTLASGFAVVRDPDNPVVHWGVRSTTDGSGERLIRDYWFGEGAVLGKHARARHHQALKLTARTFGLELRWAIMSLARLRGTNLLRASSWAAGFIKGVTMGLDASSQFFAS